MDVLQVHLLCFVIGLFTLGHFMHSNHSKIWFEVHLQAQMGECHCIFPQCICLFYEYCVFGYATLSTYYFSHNIVLNQCDWSKRDFLL